MTNEVIIHYLTCRNDRLITVLVDEQGQLVFRYENGEPYDIEIDLSEAALGFEKSRCIWFLERFRDAPFTVILDNAAVTPVTAVQFAAQWLSSMPIFDELDPEFAEEQDQAREFVVENIVNVTKKANREEHDRNLHLRVSSESLYLKNQGAPFWIHGSVEALRFLYKIDEDIRWIRGRGAVERRRLIHPIMNFDLNLRTLDQDRYSKKFASQAKRHRVFQMAQALAHVVRPGGRL